MKRLLASLAVASALLAAMPSAWAQATRTRGTIEQVSDSSLSVRTRDGRTVMFTLTPELKVIGVTPGVIADIKPDSYIGAAAIPQPDGSQRALEVSVFDPVLRGMGDGHYGWDLQPNSTMTNGAVGTVAVANGRTLTVRYNGGEKTVIVPDDVPIVTVAPADRGLLKPGVHVVVIAPPSSETPLKAAAILAGQNGLTPPM